MFGFGMGSGFRVERGHSVERGHRIEIGPEISQGIGIELAMALRPWYKPQGTCPECGHVMTPQEIMDGFRLDSETDYTTCCPECGERFEATIGVLSWAGNRYYCPLQAAAKLRDSSYWRPSELAYRDAGLYRSCLMHYGTLRAAYAVAGKDDYPYRERAVKGWRVKVAPFLDKLTDERIADMVGVTIQTVKRFRRSVNK